MDLNTETSTGSLFFITKKGQLRSFSCILVEIATEMNSGLRSKFKLKLMWPAAGVSPKIPVSLEVEPKYVERNN